MSSTPIRKPRNPQKYDAEKYGHYIPFRKKITNRWQVSQIEHLCNEWKITTQEVCCRLIVEGLQREQKLRENKND